MPRFYHGTLSPSLPRRRHHRRQWYRSSRSRTAPLTASPSSDTGDDHRVHRDREDRRVCIVSWLIVTARETRMRIVLKREAMQVFDVLAIFSSSQVYRGIS